MKRLKDVKVEFISLVARPANKKHIILKDGFLQEFKVLKSDEEKQMVYGIVYAPDQLDTQGHFTDAATIEKMAYDFMKNGRNGNIDIHHNYNPINGFVAESWIIKGNDPVFPDEPVGSWAVGIKVEDETIWEDIKKGEITGISLAGWANLVEEEPQTGGIINKMRELFGLEKEGRKISAGRLEKIKQAAQHLLDIINEIGDQMVTDPMNKASEPTEKEEHLAKGGEVATIEKDEKEKLEKMVAELQGKIATLEASLAKAEEEIKKLGNQPAIEIKKNWFTGF